MKTHECSVLLVSFALSAAPQAATAQDLFSQPGAIGLAKVNQTYTGGRYFGEDAAGYLYYGGT
jgi:hypothetical protein